MRPETSGRTGARLDPDASARTKAPTKTRTVLIVEDSPEGRDVYATALAAAGYAVVEACDGAEGIRLATEQPPDVVLMNIRMPHVNGVDAVEILKAHPATEHIPILVVTGHGIPAVRDGAWEAGCDEYLSKPLVPSDLVAAVSRCLREHGL